MTRPATNSNDAVKTLRALALAYPGTEEGTTCSRSSFKARKKAFLFMGADDDGWSAMLKLRDSLKEASALATREPGTCKVGATGWVTLTFRGDQGAPLEVLERWMDESYRLVAPRPLVAQLPPRVRPVKQKK